MLLVQTALLASLASVSGAPTTNPSPLVAPLWSAYHLAIAAPWRTLHLAPSCGQAQGPRGVPCAWSSSYRMDASPLALATTSGLLPNVSRNMGGTLGGFVNFDVMKALHLSVGPRVSWLTPDSPREDLLRLRVVAPGWGVRYTWEEAALSVGLAASTRLLIFGEDLPLVDVLTSEARVELVLP